MKNCVVSQRFVCVVKLPGLRRNPPTKIQAKHQKWVVKLQNILGEFSPRSLGFHDSQFDEHIFQMGLVNQPPTRQVGEKPGNCLIRIRVDSDPPLFFLDLIVTKIQPSAILDWWTSHQLSWIGGPAIFRSST